MTSPSEPQQPGAIPPAPPAHPPLPQAPAAAAPPYPPAVHPAPPYPTPGYQAAPPAAGFPVPGPGYPAVAPAAPPRGLLPWVLGFLIVMPFPFVGGIASGIAMAVSGGASRRAGGVARENARAALNWGLTYLLISTSLIVLHFVILFALTADSPATGFYPIGIPLTIYAAISLLHLVLVIVGTIRSSSGTVMRVPFAIPFVRA
ncbi:DUF4870 domain-containing protein [Microbacterium sp. SSW1-49]|uniref:DUF4870 domain-containing protein n=1 Tax=Microbacterium croceum TaxID=2851645 RepID=A0ABT0FDY7_9MICO|nr:DUF4870 domain-containing protein [Microbacterium croceum]MCK2036276.1 DUF4870 domain-containing protein [Microbacterium croceum]